MNNKVLQEKFPSKFVDRMREILPAGELEEFLERCTEPLPKTIRCTANFEKPKESNSFCI
jgi:16S rRNA C967 or C1407 C5-methylase (RsmB/RsmF family)